MEFIENHRADAMQLRVILDPALEHAIGEVENFCFISILRIEAHRVTYFAPNARAALFCHPSGEQSRCHASWLDDENHSLHARIKQHAGHFRRLAGTGGGFQQHSRAIAGSDSGTQGVGNFENRQ